MLQILASLLIFLNPAVAFFTPSHAPIQDASQVKEKEAAFINFDDYRLPLAENIFLASQLIPAYPIRNWNAAEPEISAKIAFVFETTRQRILWQKNGLREARPIASLTKLMTALVVMENAKLDEVFVVSKEAVQTPGELGGLIVGEQLTVENLLHALLIESSNDAAVALAEGVGNKIVLDLSLSRVKSRDSNNINLNNFINLMNQKAKTLGLFNTTFTDPSGLEASDQSSAWDLNIIMQEVLKYPTLQKITQTATFDFKSVDAKFSHRLTSTDKLLGLYPEIIAGKTGYTEEAGNCMILAFRAPNNQGIVISIIMDSQDRMVESEAILQWTKEAYLW
ncbi:serine hydrolase [Patescibacteria group bacterium]|nr:serine hydrolase [Patescibacteria group bacterium]MBU2219867.1 serine hydrolase [Patescibacteria group bacterium]MBU2265084.1 serine hydrolase [Patescibacteria group bacterium]